MSETSPHVLKFTGFSQNMLRGAAEFKSRLLADSKSLASTRVALSQSALSLDPEQSQLDLLNSRVLECYREFKALDADSAAVSALKSGLAQS